MMSVLAVTFLFMRKYVFLLFSSVMFAHAQHRHREAGFGAAPIKRIYMNSISFFAFVF